eukprot:TRINITY_DN17251_c0_g1_i1.p1 TRINITY_DN17251_c0_g1~~TRINITY_DN17251_c0_g1_i1.p1  ORF type:complete len:555 (-),score=142.13 TRINITY_DN17251_c0_g1_i1:49-1584(-)
MKDECFEYKIQHKIDNMLYYHHHYITDKNHIIQFRLINKSTHDNLYSSIISVEDYNEDFISGDKINTFKFDKSMRMRAKKVIGGTSFSFMLRNSEHVIKYIIHGIWNSPQTQKNCQIYEYFKNHFNNQVIEKLNKVPQDLLSSFVIGNRPLFSNVDALFQFEGKKKELKEDFNSIHFNKIIKELKEDVKESKEVINTLMNKEGKSKDYLNIFLLGCEDSGKSQIINLLCNQEIQDTKSKNTTHKSIHHIRCTFLPNKRNCFFIEVPYKFIPQIKLYKNLGEENVFIFVLGKRLYNSDINYITESLKRLKYEENPQKFLFLINKTASNNESEKQYHIESLSQMFKLQFLFNHTIFKQINTNITDTNREITITKKDDIIQQNSVININKREEKGEIHKEQKMIECVECKIEDSQQNHLQNSLRIIRDHLILNFFVNDKKESHKKQKDEYEDNYDNNNTSHTFSLLENQFDQLNLQKDVEANKSIHHHHNNVIHSNSSGNFKQTSKIQTSSKLK